MKNLTVKSNNLELTPTQEKLFYLSMGEVIAKHFQDETNLAKFEENKERFKKGVKELEVKRNALKKENGTARISTEC